MENLNKNYVNISDHYDLYGQRYTDVNEAKKARERQESSLLEILEEKRSNKGVKK